MSDAKKQYEEGLNTIKLLTEVSQADFDTLKEAAPQARQWVGDIAQVFYDTLFGHPRTAAVFREGERPEREKSLADWYFSLFEVTDQDAFWNTQARIGFAHIRRHINNEFMIGMAAKIRPIFRAKAIDAFGIERGMAVSLAFDRILDTVVGLTAEIYDVMSNVAFSESTGTNLVLIDSLIQESVDDVQQEVLG